MSPVHRVIQVTNAQYYLIELMARLDVELGFSGLISSNGRAATIVTGTRHGPVSVSAEWLSCEPALDIEPWDDVVDISMCFVESEAVVHGPVDRKADERIIPRLLPGSYRVRLHVRGRITGEGLGDVRGEPVEEHLLLAWHDPIAADEIRHKFTDDYGVHIRSQ
jgi:hypothetical protein